MRRSLLTAGVAAGPFTLGNTSDLSATASWKAFYDGLYTSTKTGTVSTWRIRTGANGGKVKFFTMNKATRFIRAVSEEITLGAAGFQSGTFVTPLAIQAGDVMVCHVTLSTPDVGLVQPYPGTSELKIYLTTPTDPVAGNTYDAPPFSGATDTQLCMSFTGVGS